MTGPPPGAQRLVEELQLTSEQAEQFKNLRDRHEDIAEGVLDSLHQLKDLAFRSVLNDAGDMQKAQALLKRAADFQYTLDTLTLHHVASLREVCSAEQRSKFDQIFHEFIAPPQQHGRPAPPR